MTTAHRPTWAPARGGEEQGGNRLFVPSLMRSSKDATAHTKLKQRQDGQGAAQGADLKVRERAPRALASALASLAKSPSWLTLVPLSLAHTHARPPPKKKSPHDTRNNRRSCCARSAARPPKSRAWNLRVSLSVDVCVAAVRARRLARAHAARSRDTSTRNEPPPPTHQKKTHPKNLQRSGSATWSCSTPD